MVDPLEKLKLTEGGGRRGEKGYSDSREQECVVTIKQAGTEKNGEIGENEEGEVGKRLRRVGHVRQSAGRTPSLGGRVVAAIDRSNRLAPIGIRPPQQLHVAT